MKEYLDLLGYKVVDLVTGAKGTVTSISFDLAGCVQAAVNPGVNEKGEYQSGTWFDFKRLKKTSGEPVMEQPVFEVVPGGELLPQRSNSPMI